jgi:transposase
MKKVFIGVDFSKKKFDISVLEGSDMSVLGHESFENERSGCLKMISWIRGLTRVPCKEWMFCGEHTGLYSMSLASFLSSKELFLWLENPLQIKQSSGIRRGKNDAADSLMIAQYACRYRDRARAYQLPHKDLLDLNELLSYRQRLISAKKQLLVSSVEIRSQYRRDANIRFMYEDSLSNVERINRSIKQCEEKMMIIIKANEELNENFEIVSSIKGIALINTVTILVVTRNFTSFDNSRQFACYSGLAPFGKESGTSIHTKPHVSHLADKNIKALLTQAARCAVRYNPQMRAYYERKIAEGKNSWLVINNVRNKLVHCIFSLVKYKQLYQEEYMYSTKRYCA